MTHRELIIAVEQARETVLDLEVVVDEAAEAVLRSRDALEAARADRDRAAEHLTALIALYDENPLDA